VVRVVWLTKLWSPLQGLSLQLQAMTKKGEEAEALFKLAASKYAEALAFNPNDDRGTPYRCPSPLLILTARVVRLCCVCVCGVCRVVSVALFLWGNLLSEQSKMRNDPASSHALLVLACRKYQQSYATNAASFQLLYNWGNVLLYR
jgi:hypothetical protein